MFDLAIAQSPGPIFITDCNGIIEFVDQKFYEMTGYSLHEIIVKNPRIIKIGTTPVETYRQMGETIFNGEYGMVNSSMLIKDGKHFLDNFTISPIHNN